MKITKKDYYEKQLKDCPCGEVLKFRCKDEENFVSIVLDPVMEDHYSLRGYDLKDTNYNLSYFKEKYGEYFIKIQDTYLDGMSIIYPIMPDAPSVLLCVYGSVLFSPCGSELIIREE